MGKLSLIEFKKLQWQVGDMRLNPSLTDPDAHVPSLTFGESLEQESCPMSAEWLEWAVFPKCFAVLFFRSA